MGCIARLGCLVLLVIVGCVAWLTRGSWLPEQYRKGPLATHEAASTTWQPVSNAGAIRARSALDKLGQPSGPVFQSLSAGDVASLAFSEMSTRANGAVDSVAARVDSNRMSVRANVKLANLKSRLGPLAGMLNDRETVQLSGTFNVVKPGMAAFTVQNATVGHVTLPQGMIPRLIQEIDHGARPNTLPDNALLLPVPSQVGDIRVASGKVILYKNVK
jgi:hypothetical protein